MNIWPLHHNEKKLPKLQPIKRPRLVNLVAQLNLMDLVINIGSVGVDVVLSDQ